MKCKNVIADFLIVFILLLYMDTARSKGCLAYIRIFSEVGSNATFVAVMVTENHPLKLLEFNHDSKRLFRAHLDELQRSRVFLSIPNNVFVIVNIDRFENGGNLTIILQIDKETDSGNYTLVEDFGIYLHCWTLYVLKPPTTPEITLFLSTQEAFMVEEGEPVSFSGSRSTSRSIPAGLSVTMAWLVDGFDVSSSRGLYQVSDDGLLILHTDRRLNGKNVTYRATEESGKTNEANYTFSIAYGPDPNLILNPDTSVYFVTEGDDITSVACTATCFPPCITIWTSDKLSENITGRQLTLGKAVVSMSGDYACIATRVGTYKTAKRTITVQVKGTVDNTSVIVLGSLLGITVVGLFALTVFVLFVLRRQMLSCIPGVKGRKTDTDKAINSRMRTTTPQGISNDVAMDTYTDLQSDSRDVHVETIYDPIETEAIQSGQITYENTSLPKLKYES